MSPRFTSAITRRPASRAYAHTSKNARTPSGPCASKKADCGFTAMACSATASMIPSQKARISPATEAGISSGTGSRPTTSCVRLRSTRSTNRSAKWVTATAISPGLSQPFLTADFNALPAENFGTRAAGISTFCSGLRGLTPVRAARTCVWNLPKPVNVTSPPDRSVSVTVSRKASTARPASRAVSWLRRATSATNSCLFTFPSCRSGATGSSTLTLLFALCEQLARTKERPQAHGMSREGVGAALLAIDDADGRVHDEACAAQHLQRVEEGAAGRHDVLDEADAFAVLVRPLEAVGGAVLLRLLAHDHERQTRLQRGGGSERDGTELRCGEARRVRCMLAHRCGDA